jgi:hypothetical protein
VFNVGQPVGEIALGVDLLETGMQCEFGIHARLNTVVELRLCQVRFGSGKDNVLGFDLNGKAY